MRVLSHVTFSVSCNWSQHGAPAEGLWEVICAGDAEAGEQGGYLALAKVIHVQRGGVPETRDEAPACAETQWGWDGVTVQVKKLLVPS